MQRLIIILSLLILGNTVVLSQPSPEDLTNLSFEELLNVEVISSPRLGQKANQAPTSVSVITASDIRTFGWRTLADALNAMRGIFTSNNRNYSFLGVRGFNESNDYNSRVLMMIDGQRMNENIYDAGTIGQEFMLDMDLVERIEFIPGSGSSIYGANAFLGFINVITKKGSAINGAQVAGEVGSFDTYKGRASVGKKFDNGTDMLLSASHYESAGPQNLYFPAFDKPATNNGIAHNMDTERAERLFGRVQFDDLTFSGGVVDRYKRVPTAAYGQIFNDPNSNTVDRQFFGNLNYQKSLTDKTSLLLKGFFQGYDYHAEDIYQSPNRLTTVDKTVGRWFGGETQLTTSAFDRQRLILGLEYHYDLREYQVNYDIDPYTEYLNTNRNGHRVEVFAQDDIQILDDLIFSAGLRLDYHHQIRNLQLNPRLGLIWNPLTSTTFKLLYSTSFRAPNAAELDTNLYYFGVHSTLQEEHVKSYESIVEWHSTDGLKLFGSLFYNRMTKLLDDAPNQYLANIDEYNIYGTEWEAEKRWDTGRLLKASHTYSFMANELNGGKRAYGSPEHIFKMHYAEPLFNNYAKLGVENIFIGNRKTEHGSSADPYNLININLTSDKVLQGTDLSLGVYNLLDNHYQMLGGGAHNILLMNGRELRFKLQVTF